VTISFRLGAGVGGADARAIIDITRVSCNAPFGGAYGA
jgi:hypothetical protein